MLSAPIFIGKPFSNSQIFNKVHLMKAIRCQKLNYKMEFPIFFLVKNLQCRSSLSARVRKQY